MDVIREFGTSYRDCNLWLQKVCPPWSWLLSAGSVWVPLPQSPLTASLAEFRQAVLLGGRSEQGV